MFLRKLMAAAFPLLMCLGLCVLFPFLVKTFPNLGLYGYTIEGLFIGLALALVIPLMGGRKRDPFAGLLWVPIVLLVAVMVFQHLVSGGAVQAGALEFLNASGGQTMVVEGAFLSFMLTAALRAGR